MAKKKKRLRFLIIFIVFLIYFILAARPVPRESVLVPGWIASLNSDAPILINKNSYGYSTNTTGKIPFTLGNRFGYVDESGEFIFNRVKTHDIYLSDFMWTEYEAEPSVIEIKNIDEDTIITIENVSGYPILLDDRIFIIGSEMNVLSEINSAGNVLWTYEFGGLLTCIDAAAGLVITGSIDGVVEILDSYGKRIFYYVPGGSRLEIIAGCAISKNGGRLGIVSGVDKQRFLLLERFGSTDTEYRVVYHEELGTGFRRPVHVLFIDEDRRIVYERPGGIGCYNIKSRRAFFIPLENEIAAIESCGSSGLLFLIASQDEEKNELVGIRFPPDVRFSIYANNANESIFLKAPFKSMDIFLGRISDAMLITGGGALISFTLEEL